MLAQEYFTKDEIIETLKNAKDYSEDDFYDLCEDMFHRDVYIRGTHEAYEALDTYTNDEELDGYKIALKGRVLEGRVGAGALVDRYELDQYAHMLTSEFDDEKVATMVEYIRGKTLFNKALDKAGLTIVDKPTKENLKKFIEAAKRL